MNTYLAIPGAEYDATRRSFLGSLLLGSGALIAQAGGAAAARIASLPRTAPEAVNIDPAGVLAFVEAADRMPIGLHSMMLLRHGKVAAEGWWRPYGPNHPHQLYSLSKSFTSTAVGLAVGEGRLTVDAPVTSFFPDRLPSAIGDNLAAMRVRHLLTMSTGHEQDATGQTVSAPDGDWVRAFLALPVPREPGSLFVYNSAATYLLSAIVQKLTGVTVRDYLMPRLFEPLGFTAPPWDTCPKGINTGGWGLSIRTEEIAKFGQLYLQGGAWKGKQLIPANWVSEATSKKISNGSNPASDWAQGYCYQFWRCRHGAFRGDGAFGQFCVVMPEYDAVLAITSGVNDMQGILNLAWEHLLPAFQSAGEIPAASMDLNTRLRSLAVPLPNGAAGAAVERQVHGKTYQFPANPLKLERLSIRFLSEPQFVLFDGVSERKVRCGRRKWTPSGPAFAAQSAYKTAAAGVWSDPDTYQVRLCFFESPFIQTLVLKFTGDELRLHTETNVGAAPSPMLIGHTVSHEG